MSKTIEIKKAYIRNLILSFIIGFAILFGLEHFGKFSYTSYNPIQESYTEPSNIYDNFFNKEPSNEMIYNVGAKIDSMFGMDTNLAGGTGIQPSVPKPSFEDNTPATTKVSRIKYETFFDQRVETEGNGFTVYDLSFSDTEFNKYSNKIYYYKEATIKDFKYGIFISLGLFLLTLFFTNFKIKLS